jgi:hypothetical protein
LRGGRAGALVNRLLKQPSVGVTVHDPADLRALAAGHPDVELLPV